MRHSDQGWPDDRPPTPAKRPRKVRVERFLRGEEKTFVFLGDLSDRFVHWSESLGKTVPCGDARRTIPEDAAPTCALCVSPMWEHSRRAEGFAPAMVKYEKTRQWEQAVVVFTGGGLNILDEAIAAGEIEPPPFRGRLFVAGKHAETVKAEGKRKGHKKGHMWVREGDPLHPDDFPDGLPPAFAIRPVMYETWHPGRTCSDPIEYIDPVPCRDGRRKKKAVAVSSRATLDITTDAAEEQAANLLLTYERLVTEGGKPHWLATVVTDYHRASGGRSVADDLAAKLAAAQPTPAPSPPPPVTPEPEPAAVPALDAGPSAEPDTDAVMLAGKMAGHVQPDRSENRVRPLKPAEAKPELAEFHERQNAQRKPAPLGEIGGAIDGALRKADAAADHDPDDDPPGSPPAKRTPPPSAVSPASIPMTASGHVLNACDRRLIASMSPDEVPAEYRDAHKLLTAGAVEHDLLTKGTGELVADGYRATIPISNPLSAKYRRAKGGAA